MKIGTSSFLVGFTLVCFTVEAQRGLLQPVSRDLDPNLYQEVFMPNHRMVDTCTDDQVRYLEGKLSGFPTNYNMASWEQPTFWPYKAYAQYYDAPQPVTIDRICIFGNVDQAGENPYIHTMIYETNESDSSIGDMVVLDSILVNDGFAERCVTLSSPVTMTTPYYVAIQTDHPTFTFTVVGNRWDGDNGQGERLLMGYYTEPGFDGWHNILDYNGMFWDFDIFIFPRVSYSFDAQLQTNADTLCVVDTLFAASLNPSPILMNRMYNQNVFENLLEESFIWDFGDGSPIVEAEDTAHVFDNQGTYEVKHIVEMNGWTTTCRDTAEQMVVVDSLPANVNFSFDQNGLEFSFADESSNGTSWSWDFGDGSGTSEEQHPVYTYASDGTYTVKLVVNNGCGVDSVEIEVTAVLTQSNVASELQRDLMVFPNPSHGIFTLRTSLKGVGNVQVFNLIGEKVAEMRLVYGDNALDLSQLDRGVYWLRVETNSSIATRQVQIL